MESYIEFLNDENANLIAKIHHHGKVKTIKSKTNIAKLQEICQKYGYDKINEPGYLEDFVREISLDYQKYYNRKKKKEVILYNTINGLMKLTKTKPGKILLLSTFVSIGAFNLNSHYQPPDATSYYEEQADIDEDDYLTSIMPENISIEQSIIENAEMESMLRDNIPVFTYDYDNSINHENFLNAQNYQDIFEKYGSMYGIDPNLLMALAAQESGGNHYDNLNNGPAQGIMQIEKSAHLNQQVTAYNHLTGEEETITVTPESLEDLDTNIKIGTMILQNSLEMQNYNIPLALQTYNFGPGNMSKALNMCEELSGVTVAEMKNNMQETEWRYYRKFLDIGDPYYVEHVFSFLNCSNDSNINEIYVKNRADQQISIRLENEALNTKTM